MPAHQQSSCSQEQMVRLPQSWQGVTRCFLHQLRCPHVPLARDKWDTLLLCTGSTGKSNPSWLLAACRGISDSQQLCDHCCGSFQRWLSQLKSLWVALTTSTSLCSEKQQKQKNFLFTTQSLPVGPQHIHWHMEKWTFVQCFCRDPALLQQNQVLSHAIVAFPTRAVAAESAHFFQLSNSHSPTFPSYSWGDTACWVFVPTCSCSIKWTIFHYLDCLDSSPQTCCCVFFWKASLEPFSQKLLCREGLGVIVGWLLVIIWRKGWSSTATFCHLTLCSVAAALNIHGLGVIAREKDL